MRDYATEPAAKSGWKFLPLKDRLGWPVLFSVLIRYYANSSSWPVGMRRRRNVLRAIIVSLFALVSESGAHAQEWEVFEDQTLGFRVELPGTPIITQEPVSAATNLSISVGELSVEIIHTLSK